MSHRSALFNKRSSREHFLLRQSERPAVDPPARQAAAPSEPDLVKAVFPDIPAGDDFFHAAVRRTAASSGFAILVARIDLPADPAAPSPSAESRLEVARCVNQVCRENDGLWGAMAADRFACLLPRRDTSGALVAARRLQHLVQRRGRGTLTVGTAAYPCVNYHRGQILDNAFKALRHAAFFGPDSAVAFDAVSLNISGDAFYARGDLAAAMNEYRLALQLNPTDVNVHNSLGVCYGQAGELEAAAEAFEKAAWLDPGEVMPVYNLGVVHLLGGRREKALDQFLTAVALNGDIFEVLFEIGRLYLDLDAPEKALPHLERAVALKPDAPRILRYLGDCHAALSHHDRAVKAYQGAVRRHPNDANALSALGFLYALNGENLDIARLFCQQSITIEPHNGLFHHRLGQVLLKEQCIAGALDAFRQALARGYDSRSYVDALSTPSAGGDQASPADPSKAPAGCLPDHPPGCVRAESA